MHSVLAVCCSDRLGERGLCPSAFCLFAVFSDDGTDTSNHAFFSRTDALSIISVCWCRGAGRTQLVAANSDGSSLLHFGHHVMLPNVACQSDI